MNSPFSLRYSMTSWALRGPIPGRVSRAALSAVLRLIFSVLYSFEARGPGVPVWVASTNVLVLVMSIRPSNALIPTIPRMTSS